MSQSSIPLSELGGSMGKSLTFTEIGEKHIGRILAVAVRNQTDPVTGVVKTFSDGTPRTQLVISLEMPDGETGALYARGGKAEPARGSGKPMLNAITDAARAAQAQTIEAGAELAVAFTGEGAAKPGLNPTKLFTAQYRPPAPPSVSVDDLFGQ